MTETQGLMTQSDRLGTQMAQINTEMVKKTQQLKETGIELQDLEIPKLMLMQSTSEAVGDKLAAFGDVLNTMSSKVVGGVESPVEIVPLKHFKTLRIYNAQTNPPKFLRAEPVTPSNEKLPWEGVENGIPIKRVLNMNFFVLVRSEISEGEAFPAVVSFKSTSTPAGKQLATQMFKMIQLERPPYAQSVNLLVKTQKKEKNTYAVFGIEKGSNLDANETKVAAKWCATLAAANVHIQDDEPTEVQEELPLSHHTPSTAAADTY